MNTDEMIELCTQHTMYTWASGDAVKPLPIKHADGIYLYGPNGERYIDFNSQLMCVNVGHNHPRVRDAIKEQVDTLTYAFPGSATEARARTAKLLAEVVPGDIDTFFFCLSGAEANENAIKAARLYTGKHKILSRYRSYHGATHGAMQLTGDPRRWAQEPGAPGFVKVMDPRPYRFSFGESEEAMTAQNLEYLEEVIMYEGPQNIAAMFVETVTGTNGVQPPPAGYMRGLRELLSRHEILLICDEVMCGFGRTGKMFAFEHYGITPDIVTMAKGLTSAYAPLAAMGVSAPIARHFKTNTFWGGLTYNSHCVGLAAAHAAVSVLIDEGLIENSARLGPVMLDHMNRLAERHPCVKEGRAFGLFGMVDLQKNSAGERIAGYNENHPAMIEFKQALLDRGLFTYTRWGSFMCNPPLCITEEQLAESFDIIDECLEIPDRYFEG